MAEHVKFEIVFGVSDSSWALYDLDRGRRAIGYFSQSKSEISEKELPWCAATLPLHSCATLFSFTLSICSDTSGTCHQQLPDTLTTLCRNRGANL
eukprot:COSAG05_NODE_1750_length_4147_cov_2.788538_3_plen_95_part_00